MSRHEPRRHQFLNSICQEQQNSVHLVLRLLEKSVNFRSQGFTEDHISIKKAYAIALLSERLGLNGGIYGGIVITDCSTPQPQRVLGEVGGEWERGARGWGSGPGFSDFQQNPLEETGLTSKEVYEAAADMFLNWVYRRNSNTVPNDPCTDPLTGTWEGFKNVDWSLNPPQNDNTRPGNRRYKWMEDTMNAIFGDHPW